MRGATPPIDVGQEVTAVIESVGAKGDGMARIKGFVVFVTKAKEGKTYKIQITKVQGTFGFGEIINEVAGQ